MIYLNDVNDGGETRFDYQDLNLKPTKGTAVTPYSPTYTMDLPVKLKPST